jgi:hypothetical protein
VKRAGQGVREWFADSGNIFSQEVSTGNQRSYAQPDIPFTLDYCLDCLLQTSIFPPPQP